jgi:hypothetical protein
MRKAKGGTQSAKGVPTKAKATERPPPPRTRARANGPPRRRKPPHRVRAVRHGFLIAIQCASHRNINPGGGVMHRPLNWRHMKRIPADLRNRLLSKEEVDTRLDVLGD